MSSDKSLEQLDEYVRKNPNDPAGVMDLARAHVEAGNPTRAREVLDRLLKSQENDGGALLLRSEILVLNHDWMGAWRDLREAERCGTKAPFDFKAAVYYRQWLLLHNEGWRPEPLSRYMTLTLSVIVGSVLLYMSLGVLRDAGFVGFVMTSALGMGFVWAGLAIGGMSLWLKKIEDARNPGWDEPLIKAKTKEKGK